MKIKRFNQFSEALSNKHSIDQLKMVSKIMGDSNIGTRVSDSSFSNALKNTKRDVTKFHIDTYEDFINEPFSVNQNRIPWESRKKKKKKK